MENLKNDSKSEKANAGLSIIGGATEMAWFMIKYAEKYQTVALDIFTNKVGIRLGPSIGARITSSFLGKVSFGIGVVTATFDSVMSFKRRDNDAGVAYIGVALCTAMPLFLITATGKGLAVSAGGVAGICISGGALLRLF